MFASEFFMKIVNAKVFTKDFNFANIDIEVNGTVFGTSFDNEIVDAKGLMAIPGLIDTHFHGSLGADFMDSTPKSLEKIAKYQVSVGVTSICPASMTMGLNEIASAFANAAHFKAKDDEADLVGIYMEGPFVSHLKLGAQNPKYVMAPDPLAFRQLQHTANGLVKVLAIAPEVPTALDTIKLLQNEVKVSIAHTGCSYDIALKAIENGAKRLTHTFNAMPGINHRSPGPILAAVDAPWCEAEIITDGVHIHPSAVRAAFKLFGPEKMILISDSMMAAGLDDGEYSLGGQAVFVEGRKATLKDGTIAGSATNLYDCMVTAVKEMQIPLVDAIRAATYNPARSIGILDKCGSIDYGKKADLLLIDEDLNLKAVLLRGKWVKSV